MSAISTDLLNKLSPAATTTTTASDANQQVSSQQFLTLFIAQLQNQDPLSPMDPQQLTGQLAQLSSLEQLTGINTRLDKLTSAQTSSTTSALLGLIGKQVTFDGSTFVVKNGAAPDTSYTLTGGADKVTASIVGSDGTVLRTVELGAQGAGTHTFTFDGKNADGVPLADGTYKLEIDARATGASTATAVTLSTTAPVDGVDFSGDTPTIIVDGQHLTLDQVREVHSPSAS